MLNQVKYPDLKQSDIYLYIFFPSAGVVSVSALIHTPDASIHDQTKKHVWYLGRNLSSHVNVLFWRTVMTTPSDHSHMCYDFWLLVDELHYSTILYKLDSCGMARSSRAQIFLLSCCDPPLDGKVCTCCRFIPGIPAALWILDLLQLPAGRSEEQLERLFLNIYPLRRIWIVMEAH